MALKKSIINIYYVSLQSFLQAYIKDPMKKIFIQNACHLLLLNSNVIQLMFQEGNSLEEPNKMFSF